MICECIAKGRNLEMNQIRYFLAVSETLNLTKAAERCSVAQPSITRAIKALETELGGELLRRERSLSHLTELGQRMLPMLRLCYETAVMAKTVAASIRKGEAARLSIAVSQTLSLERFTPALRELSRALPGLQLRLYRGSRIDVAQYLKSGMAELAIAGPLSEVWSRLEAFPLFEEPLDLVVSRTHRLAGSARAEFKDLASETLLINTGSEMVEELRACLEAKGILDNAAYEVPTQADLLTLLNASLGVAIIPVALVETKSLSRVPLEQLDLVHKTFAYTIAGRRRGIACATLLNMLRAAEGGFDIEAKRQTKSH
jgi:DNA-binding transcriptional LysR family regulator